MADVALRNVTKSFGATRAVDAVSMEIANGAFMVLLGPTGAGKTTTLRLISGLEAPDAGNILIGGRSVLGDTPAQRNVAMVFQQYSLYPHMTVRENLAFPLRSPALRTPEDQIRTKVAEVLRIGHKLDNKATSLSGGEMQRVSIGRALVRSPEIFLMDEPLSSHNAKLRAELRVELKRIHETLGATLLYVTHDQIEAMAMATSIGVLHEGRLVQVGRPREIYENPVSLYVACRGSMRCRPACSRARPPGLRSSVSVPSTSSRARADRPRSGASSISATRTGCTCRSTATTSSRWPRPTPSSSPATRSPFSLPARSTSIPPVRGSRDDTGR